MSRIALLSYSEFGSIKRGSQVYSLYLQKALPQMELITLDQCPPIPKIFRSNWRRFGLEEVKKSWWLSRHFLKMHYEKPFDLVITYAEEGWFLGLKNLSIPRIQIYIGCFSAYADFTLKGKKGYFASRYLCAPFEKLSGRGATCIVISTQIQKEIEKRYRLKSKVIPVGVDLNHWRVVPQQGSKSRPIGLFVGQAQFGKGWDIIEKLAAAFPNIQFVCVLSEKISPRYPNICPLYNISNEEMNRWYNAADFFVFPSRYESAALVALEAMACNLPVIISERVAKACIDQDILLSPHEGTYIVEEFSDHKYAEAIQTCLAKKERGRTRHYVEQTRSFSKFQENMKQLVDSF